MSSWFRTGQFEKERIHGWFHPFVPAHAVNILYEIDLDELWARGKRLILVDIDNTLVQWKTEDFAEPVLDWIRRAKEIGFEICIISNTTRVDRLNRISEMVGAPHVRGRFKPSRAMFRLALLKFKRRPEEAIMVGDQLMTDVFGANRSGIEAIWVRKMEGKEFGGTRVNRFIEKLLSGPIYKALITPIDEQPDSPEVEQAKPVADRVIVHQFIKFCIVGGTSFIVDFVIRWSLMFFVPWRGELLSVALGRWLIERAPNLFAYAAGDPLRASVVFIIPVAAAFAILNSFIWNRRWTFQIRGREGRMAELRRFYLVAVIGLLLNTAISSFLYNVVPGHPKVSLAVATVVAAGVVAIWNFTGQRLYAFRPKLKEREAGAEGS